MGQEIEHRYLLSEIPDLGAAKPQAIAQGYLSTDPDRVVRVRIRDEDGFLTIKGRRTGAVAAEFEYAIPVDDARALLALCGENVLIKNRYELTGEDGFVWEVDIFTGRHDGLVIAEIELPAADTAYNVPGWLRGVDITGRTDLGNAALVQMPQAALDALLRR